MIRALAAASAMVLAGAMGMVGVIRWVARSVGQWGPSVSRSRATAAVLLLVLLLLPVALAVGVEQRAAALPIDTSGVASLEPVQELRKPAQELRVPIIRSGGRLDRAFPDGIPMGMEGGPMREDQPMVIATLSLVASDAGVADLFDAILDRSEPPYVLDEEYRPEFTYPYHYPRFHDLLASRLTDDFVARHRDDLVELSSGLLFVDRAAPAYTILSLVRQQGNSCDVQLNLALTVAIGFSPRVQDVEHEFLAARDQCTADPIAYTTHAMVVHARESRGGGSPRSFYLGDLGQEDEALAILREGAEAFPGHGSLAAVEANILLDVADKYRAAAVHPFTVRSMYARALGLLDAVVAAGADDPTVHFARARAMAGLGQDEMALSVGRQALASMTTRDVSLGRTTTHRAALNLGDLDAALDTYPPSRTRDPQDEVDRRRCRSLINGNLSPTNPPEAPWALAGARCHVVLLDATGGQFPSGADTFDYVDYIPNHRSETVPLALLEAVAGRSHPYLADDRADRATYEAMLAQHWSEEVTTHHVETMQDGLRRLGLFDEAAVLLHRALEEGLHPKALWFDRLGEVAYLTGDFPGAAEHFLVADRPEGRQQFADWRQQEHWYREWHAGHDWSAIKAAAALHAADRDLESLEILNALNIPSARNLHSDWTPAQLEIARSTLRGTVLTRMESHAVAASNYLRALEVCRLWQGTDSDPCASGVQDNNLAVSLLQTDESTRALQHARAAVAADPVNPMFVELVANVLEHQGDHAQALGVYREAFAADPTQVTALNNAGVILAQKGETAEAASLFRRAVGARPDYTLAWMNLGLAMSEVDSVTGFLSAQAAWAQAARLGRTDPGSASEYVTEQLVYEPGLDLSRPLPAEWSAGASRTVTEKNLTLGLMVLAGLHVLKVMSEGQGAGWAARRVVGVSWWSRFRLPSWLAGPGASVAVLVLAAGYPVVLSQGGSVTVVALTAAVTALMGGAFLAARTLAGGAEPHSLSVGGAVVTAGLLVPLSGAFVSTPVLKDQRAQGLVRWSPLLFLGAVAVIAILCSEWTGAPFIRGIGQTAVLLVGSALLAVPPFDGAVLSRRASAAVAVVLLVPTVFFAASWW